ncbi:hypothetical protein MMC22_003796 [Lobaria immixta]|nr:hypothetical protein [Lobaria immixta]
MRTQPTQSIAVKKSSLASPQEKHKLISRPPPRSYIFTDFQTATEKGVSVAAEYAAAARRRGCAFIPVVLTCGEVENERRMRWPKRLGLVEAGMGMLVDTDVLKRFRRRRELYRFQGSEQLVLDVTDITPAQAAEKIMQHINLVTGVMV